jgi:hypothetical protein
VSGNTKKKARESAERCIPLGAPQRPLRIDAFIDGYMAGHAAHTRWANRHMILPSLAEHSSAGEKREG